MTTRIFGTGSALPEKIITNDHLSEIMDTSDEWIQSRTGIQERRLVSGEETVASLAIEAGKKALENSGCRAQEIQLVLAATCTSEYYFPNLACQVAAGLGIENAAAMDLNAACSGFLFALNTAHAYILAGIYDKVLIVGAETLSRVIDWKDRSTCVLFGDGAGACVVGADETGMKAFVQHSDGTLGHVLTCTGQMLETPALNENVQMEALHMDGQAVFKFAVKKVPECIMEILEKTGDSLDDVKYFVLHQANKRILQSVAKRLHVPEEKFPMNLDKKGNTSAASIPILLDEMNRAGMLNRGDKIVLSGFGAGLTWGAAYLQW